MDIIEQHKELIEKETKEKIYKQNRGNLWMSKSYIYKYNIKDNVINCWARCQTMENKIIELNGK